MKVRTDTSEYYTSHLKEPRGRGLWGFRIMLYVSNRGWTELADQWSNGTYGAAKAAATASAKSEASLIGGGDNGSLEITVLP